MEILRVVRLLCYCACVTTTVNDAYGYENSTFCNGTPIASSLMFRMFPADVVKSQDDDITTELGDISELKLLGTQMTVNHIISEECDEVPARPDGIDSDILTITDTAITILQAGSFTNWSNLQTLRIISNDYLYEIDSGAFEGLDNLWKLEIMVNAKLSSFKEDSLKGLTNLRALFLKRNNISNISHISRALTLKYVPNLLVLDLTENNILTIGEYDFEPMKGSNIYTLMIGLTKTVNIHPRALDPFQDSIVSLGFSQVNVDKAGLVDFINRTTVINKNLTYLSLRENLLCGSPRELMEVMSNSVVGLDLGNNHFGLMEPGFFPVMHKLKYLDLTNVMMDEIPQSIINSTVFPKLEHLYLGGNMINKLTTAMITPTLSRLVVSNSPHSGDDTGNSAVQFEISSSVLKTMPNLEFLDLSGNNINQLTKTLFYHAPQLKVLFLQSTSLIHIENRSFERNTELYFLDLSYNMFPLVSTWTGEIFYGLSNLIALDLSYCYINTITQDVFDHIPQLQYLSLRGNAISTLGPGLFESIPYLKSLDLRYNILVSWHDEILSEHHCLQSFMLIYNNIMKLTDAMLNDFSKVNQVSLFANSISCDCDVFQNVIKNKIDLTKSAYLMKTQCSYPVGMNITLFEYLHQPLYDCISYKKAIIASCIMILIILALILTVLYYKYKYDVQYHLLIFKKKLGIGNIYRTKKKGAMNRGFFKYDAFVSYSAYDSSFVEKMMMILEKDGSKYKLCVFERDFQPGDNLVDRILECMEISMVTILILTEAFARSEWCRWEMTIAQNKVISQHFLKDSLILVVKSKIPQSLMTPTLKYLMETRVYLEWHEHSSVRQNIFWEKLKDALKEKIQEPRMPLPDLTQIMINGHHNTHTD